MHAMTTRSSDKSLTNQHSNSESNLHSELGPQSTRDAFVENGNQTDSDNGEVASALVASNRILHVF